MTAPPKIRIWTHRVEHLKNEVRVYVSESQNRLIAQFDDIESDMDKAAQSVLEALADRYNPQYNDPSTFYEAAYDAALDRQLELFDLRTDVYLALLAGLYRKWEVRLKTEIASEARRHRLQQPAYLWKANFNELKKMSADAFNISSKQPFFDTLDEMRLIVNVYKHGNGTSLKQLAKKHPTRVFDSDENEISDSNLDRWAHTHLAYEMLNLDDEMIPDLGAAIMAFWDSLPTY